MDAESEAAMNDDTPVGPEAAAAADTAGASLDPRPAAWRGWGRWILATAVATLVIVASAAVALLLTAGAGPSGLLAHVPADSVAYAEFRLDLPGDQRRQVGRFLAHFPGFDDQSLLEAKLDDLFERALGAATEGRVHWSGGVDTWFGGEAAVVLRALPEPARGARGASPLLLANVRDPAAAWAWSTATLDALGLSWTRDSIAGVDVLRVGGSVEPRAIAVTDEVLVGGLEVDVRAVLETEAGESLAAQADPKAALAALPADHVLWLYVDGRAGREWLARVGAGLAPGVGSVEGDLLGLGLPEWLSVELRFDGDDLVVEAAAPLGAASPGPTLSKRLAEAVPAETLAFVGVAGVGATLIERVEELRADPTFGPTVEEVTAALDRFGGLAAIVGWLDEVGLVVGSDGRQPWAAVLAVPSDRARAEALAGSLLNLASLTIPGLEVERETVGETTIVSVELPSGTVGPGGRPDPSGRLGVAWAIAADLVVLGPDPGTVRRILEVEPATSLAATKRYATLIERAGGTGAASLGFADLVRLRELLEADLSGGDRTRYERDIRPYLVPFDAVVGVTRTDGSLRRSIVVVSVEGVE